MDSPSHTGARLFFHHINVQDPDSGKVSLRCRCISARAAVLRAGSPACSWC
jgi:hypothetical protein